MNRRCLGCMKEYDAQFDICPHCGYIYGTEAELEYHLQPGMMLSERYQIGKVLGFGGFGITYIGWDTLLERKVAIKEYLPSNCATREISQTHLTIFQGEKEQRFHNGLVKFQEEAKRLAKFQEVEGIVQIYDSVLENNTAYIIMEYLEGETLKERLDRDKTIPVDEAINLVKPILKALETVHEIGIIHRDIAPDNIFLCEDENGVIKAKLLDFGAARFATTSHSTSLSVLVKEGYSPVEQYSSQGEQGPWSDVYAIAATLYHMITGEVPQKAMERYSNDEVKKPSKTGISIKKSTETAILNAMNVTQEYRTKSAKNFLDELEADQVKRVREIIIRTDIGRWPRWLKITTGGFATVVAGFIILLVTGVIHFDILTFGKSTVPEGMTRVPNFINMNQEKASKKSEDAKLIFQILDKQYSNDIPKNKILSQSHLGGSIVAEESTIGVIVSAGIEKVFVPDVINFMEVDATQKLLDANLDYSITSEEGEDAPGSVISQSIEEDKEVDSGTIVELVVSLGLDFDDSKTSEIPNLVGMDYKEAKQLLLERGLYIAKTDMVYSETVPKNQIIEQDLNVGDTIPQNSTIMVLVSSGRGDARVPDVQYKTLEEARKMLENSGFTVVIKYEDSNIVAKGNVIRQDKKASESLEMGSKITIYISNGNEKADNTMTKEDVVITQEVQEEADKKQEEAEKNPTPAPITKPEEDKKEETKEPEKESEKESEKEEKPVIDTSVAIPDVTGKDEATAQSVLSASGFTCTSVRAFSSTVPEGYVIKQSIAAGTKMQPGTLVTITVSKGASASQTGVWTEDASYANNPHYNVQTKTQYRQRTRSVQYEQQTFSSTQSSPWVYVSQSENWSEYGAWSEWSTNAVSASESRKVETKNETTTTVVGKEFNYARGVYVGSDGLVYYTYSYDYAINHGGYWEERGWSPEEYFLNVSYDGVWGTPYQSNGIWFHEQVRDAVATNTITYYRYCDRQKVVSYVYKRPNGYTAWSSWSGWQDGKISSSDLVEVETRTMYYYTEK